MPDELDEILEILGLVEDLLCEGGACPSGCERIAAALPDIRKYLARTRHIVMPAAEYDQLWQALGH